MRVKGTVAIITGGARGLGKAFSEALLTRGGKVCFADVNVQEGESTERTFNEKYGSNSALFVKCDVTKENDFKGLFKAAKEKFKDINIVVNNAGILNEAAWEKTIEINLLGMMRGTLLAVEYMRKDKGGNGGLIINVASGAGIYPAFFMPAYTASKFGVVGLTRSWAENPQSKACGLSFACLCPAFSDTNMFQDTIAINKPPLIFYEETKELITQTIDRLGVNSVDTVAQTFMELVDKDDCNGDVVTVDTVRGNKYHYNRKLNKL